MCYLMCTLSVDYSEGESAYPAIYLTARLAEDVVSNGSGSSNRGTDIPSTSAAGAKSKEPKLETVISFNILRRGPPPSGPRSRATAGSVDKRVQQRRRQQKGQKSRPERHGSLDVLVAAAVVAASAADEGGSDGEEEEGSEKAEEEDDEEEDAAPRAPSRCSLELPNSTRI